MTRETDKGETPALTMSEWFAEEVLPHDAQLRAYLRGTFPSVRDVDDLAQESLLRVWRAGARAPLRSARAFLFQVARRLALNVIRRRDRAPFVEAAAAAIAAVPDAAPDAREAALVQERIELLADALMALPPRCRSAVVLHKLRGLPQAEVAARLGLSERTVETHVRSGAARCLAYLRARGLGASSGHEN